MHGAAAVVFVVKLESDRAVKRPCLIDMAGEEHEGRELLWCVWLIHGHGLLDELQQLAYGRFGVQGAACEHVENPCSHRDGPADALIHDVELTSKHIDGIGLTIKEPPYLLQGMRGE